MPKKTTSHLENELKNSTSLDTFLEKHQDELSDCSLSDQLGKLLREKGLTKAEVVKECNLNEVYAYQILSGVRRPSRDKLLCLCFAMKATLAETQSLLKESGFAPLYVRSHRDSIIIFAITHGHTLLQLNTALYDHGEPVVE
ncbi:MAG: helix-turn-helix domain-containing protein [Emergencia sp.]